MTSNREADALTFVYAPLLDHPAFQLKNTITCSDGVGSGVNAGAAGADTDLAAG